MTEIAVGIATTDEATEANYSVAYEITKGDTVTTEPLEATVIVHPPIRDNRSLELISSILGKKVLSPK